MFNQGAKKISACVSVFVLGIAGTVMDASQGMAMEQDRNVRPIDELSAFNEIQNKKRDVCSRFTDSCRIFYVNNNQFYEADHALTIIDGFNLSIPLDLDVLHTLIILSVGQKIPERIQFILDYRNPYSF